MIHTITMAFTEPHILRFSLESYYKTATEPTTHYVLDNHYPIKKTQNSIEVQQICKDFNCHYITAGKNLGLHHGFNFVYEQLTLQPHEIVIGYDHDSNPVTKGWDKALCKVLHHKEENIWCGMMFPIAYKDIQKAPVLLRNVDDVRYAHLLNPIVNSVCGIKASFLKLSKGLQESTNFYGHLEVVMWDIMKKHHREWLVLLDYFEEPHPALDHRFEYSAYKWAHAHERSHTGDFESYLATHFPHLLDK